jgi:catabolite repression HPr-like protein
MVEKNVTVGWRNGLSVRQAAEIISKSSKFTSNIILRKDNMTTETRSILSLMALEATYKTKLTIIVDGKDENQAIKTLSELFNYNEVNNKVKKIKKFNHLRA